MGKLVRLAVLSIVSGSGSKKKSGGAWNETDFWKYESEEKEPLPVLNPNTPEYKEWYYNLKKTHNIP